ncbi:MAG: type II CRISPR RNA-guided endonuclease Cas9 [Spirochaetales bacterium]|nr:type II CRISPR RNA-guided endonuclease Cas9 [Spirochaetales bacterium]
MAKKIDYRLGLDLGTNSIGWAIYDIDSENKPISLVDMGVRIFSDGRNPKTKEPLAVERRTARGIRKQIYRRKLRRKQTFRLLQKEGLFPKTKEECLALKSLNPYELRIKALDSVLESFELGRVLFNLSVRRGFKSNRKDSTREDALEKGTNSEKLTQNQMCSELIKAISDSKCRTVGEFLWKSKDGVGGIRFVPGRTNYYPLRQMYIDEFNLIRQKQEDSFKNVDWDSIYKSIFDQRPLKPQERGRCQYMPEMERSYKALPSSEKIRVLQEVRNLNYQTEDGKVLPLSEEQEDKLISILYSQATIKFDAMKKKLGLSLDCTFNLESQNRTGLNGCPTAVKLRNEKCFGKIWDELGLDEQDIIVEKLITAEEDSEVMEMLSKYNLTSDQKENIIGIILANGTTMLCKEVTQAIVGKMEGKETRPVYSTAVQMLGYKYANQTVEKFDQLPYYGKVLVGSTMGIKSDAPEDKPELKYGKISNPTVHVALNQTRTIVNALIKEYGKPKQIVVELSRDLKNSREAKEKMLKQQAQNTKRNEVLNKNLSDAYKIVHPSRTDRLKFRLWEELGVDTLSRKCIYCGKNISGAELFTKNIEIEHILPFSRTLLDAESNLTIAHSSCNAYKKERSPFEAFGSSPSGYSWTDILTRANSLKNPAKRSRFSENAMTSFEEDSKFIARQLTDNAYLSKSALKYLKSVCDDVWSVNGGMTKLLRDKWEIDSILKRQIGEKEAAYFNLKDEQIGTYRKNRYDHRHHALDASVIALVDRGMVQEISHLNAMHRKNRIEVPQMPVLRSELIDKVKHIVPSLKPDHGVHGKLSKETLLGKIRLPVNGNEVFVTRESIESFKSVKDFESIVDEKIKADLKKYVAEASASFEKAVLDFASDRGIKKLRCINRVQTPIVINGEVPRYLAPEDYFAAVVWQLPPKKEGAGCTYQAQYVRRDEIDSKGNIKTSVVEAGKPHPAAKNIGTVHKGDYLEFTENGKSYLCRIAGYAATNNKFDYRPVCAVSNCADWLTATSDVMTEPCWKMQKLQNWISVNILFGIKNARFVTVSPIGRIFRK